MKIAILSRDGTLYSCKRLREAAIQRGHLVEILDPLSCYMNINPAASSIHYKGRKLPHFDAVIPRIGTAITFYGTAALRQFEMLGSYPLNESVAIARARDKLRSMQLLARQGIDLPVTGIAHSPDDTSDLIDMVGGAPLVVKLVEGTQGIGVVLAETRQAAESVIDAFREKSDMDGDLINIGFMVFQPELFDLIEGDETVFEKGPLTKLVAQKQLVGYIHRGFWQCMDTLREKQKLEQLWASGNAPWKVWEK